MTAHIQATDKFFHHGNIKNTVNYKAAGEHNEYRKKDNTDRHSTINIDSINISVI